MIWYLVSMKHELERLRDGKFFGNISFQLNIKEGGIASMNVVLSKSIKEPAEYADRMSLVEELVKT